MARISTAALDVEVLLLESLYADDTVFYSPWNVHEMFSIYPEVSPGVAKLFHWQEQVCNNTSPCSDRPRTHYV